MGIRLPVSRAMLAQANERRNWRLHADFARRFIRTAGALYADEDLGLALANTVYPFDAKTIDLCLSLFPWAPFQRTKAAVRLHTLMDWRGSIPTFIDASDGKLHDLNIVDQLVAEPGAFYVMDRGDVDAARLHALHQAGAFFVIRAKSNLQYGRRSSRPVDESIGLRSDPTIVLTGAKSSDRYPDNLRRVTVRDIERGRTRILFTNHFGLDATPIAELYRNRWQIELFFNWIKQNLRIPRSIDVSENAVKTQIWFAISVYVLIAIVGKRLALGACPRIHVLPTARVPQRHLFPIAQLTWHHHARFTIEKDLHAVPRARYGTEFSDRLLEASLYTFVQVFSINIFERRSINQLRAKPGDETEPCDSANKLKLPELFFQRVVRFDKNSNKALTALNNLNVVG